MDSDRLLSAYDYHLPEGYIAQAPAVPRDSSRLLVVNHRSHHNHAVFRDLSTWLKPGDLLVMNNTRVIPARLYGRKTSGLPVEVLLLEPQPEPNRWLALVKPGRRLKPGAQILFGHPGSELFPGVSPAPPPEPGNAVLSAKVVATDPPTGGRFLEFEVPSSHTLEDLLAHLGQVPLPPYISETEAEPEQYQTVYAAEPGAVAAPTAGLHFTPELLTQLSKLGIEQAFLTLHIGVGTFRPVEAEVITDHQMHAEWFELSAETVAKIRETKAKGGRVIAVGTTVVRSLEGAAQSGQLQPYKGKTNLFIYPGYRWQVVDGLITNFHLPRSSLMMLVSAMIGRERLLQLYQVAVDQKYRFYSFGDAMLILPEATLQYGEGRTVGEGLA
jgi:S-adenosylmethionine:tRNA ribosyltransferase-isomerase